MTEETIKQKKRRSPDEIAAEKRAWLEKHEWRGPIEAVATLKACAAALEEAGAQSATKVPAVPSQFAAIITAARKLAAEIEAKIPQTKK